MMTDSLLYIGPVTVYTPGQRLEAGAVLVQDGRIKVVAPADQLAPPAGAHRLEDVSPHHLLAPGFIDLQINGAFGHDFTEAPASIWQVARDLPRYGVTAFLPTIITCPLARIGAAQQALAAGPPAGFRGALPLGLHVEGPFLNPDKKGAHNARYLREPLDAAAEETTADWSRENGIWLVTLAPELPGALPLIESLSRREVVVSAGHSLATFREAEAAIAAGIRYGTHLWNAMPTLHHREPGLAGALLADERVRLGLIADGIHVHPALVKVVAQAVGPERLTLVSDAMAALGMAPGRYELGATAVTVDEESARLADGTLAGSLLSPDVALRNLLAYSGRPLQEALPALSSVPAALLGLEGRKGQIAAGYDADMVLLDQSLQVQQTVVGGQIAFRKKDGMNESAGADR